MNSPTLKQKIQHQVRNIILTVSLALIGYPLVFRVEQWIPLLITGFVLVALASSWKKAGPLPTARGTLKRAAIVSVPVILTFVLLEFAARPILSKAVAWGVPVLKPHGELMYALRPGAEGDLSFVQDDGSRATYPVRISSQGLRDDEFGPREPNEYRVLLLGDSFVFGHGLTREQTISRRLQILLSTASPRKKISVINAGVVGYGPWQEHGLMREIGFALKPDLVILQLLPTNDLGDTMIRDFKVPRSYARLTTAHKVTRLFAARDWKMQLDLWLLDHSVLYKFVYVHTQSEFSLTRTFNATRMFHNSEYPQFPASLDRAWLIEADLRDWYPELEAGRQSFEDDVLAIIQDCKERSIDSVVLVVPSRESVLNGYWNAAVSEDTTGVEYERGKAVRITESFLAREDVPFIPLDNLIKDHPDPKDLYYLLDGHFKPLGAQIVSERIAERVLRDYLVKS